MVNAHFAPRSINKLVYVQILMRFQITFFIYSWWLVLHAASINQNRISENKLKDKHKKLLV